MKKYKCQPLNFEYRGPERVIYYKGVGVPTYCKMAPYIVDDLGTAGILVKTGNFIRIKVENADLTYEIVDSADDGDWVCRLIKAQLDRPAEKVGAFGISRKSSTNAQSVPPKWSEATRGRTDQHLV